MMGMSNNNGIARNVMTRMLMNVLNKGWLVLMTDGNACPGTKTLIVAGGKRFATAKTMLATPKTMK